MPNIPNVPGVPPLPSYSPNTIVLLAADVVLAILGLFGSQWGVFLDGAKAFDYHSIVDFDYKQDWPTSDYPVEDGGFQSYDKVELPFDVRVRVARGGTESDRESLLSSVRAAAGTLDLFDVVTPEQTYSDCNITHVDFKRSSAGGVGLIIIDIWFTEIRQTSTSNFTQTQQPGNSGQVNTGNVSPQAPATSEIDKNFDNGTWGVQ
jgi:hypothetical protein